jgi:glycosyltransferase involved in cell wall biosynthesis
MAGLTAMGESPAAEPRTTFVIASRNRARELADVVTRLLDTTRCPIVVVDNDSEDNSVETVRRLAEHATDRVQVIELPTNEGAVGRNVGVAASRTPYAAFCDDDSWWAPDATEIAEELFDRHPTVGVLAARTLVAPDNHEDPIVPLLANSPLGWNSCLPGPSILGFLSCSAIVRKAAFEGAGGFSPILHFRGEERLLALDLAALGWDLCFAKELLAYHLPSPTRPSNAAQNARSLRNDVLTTWLRRPLPQCVKAGVALARAGVGDVEHAKAAAEAIRLLPSVARERRRLPTDVEQSLRILQG